jgi:hypothetical protein
MQHTTRPADRDPANVLLESDRDFSLVLGGPLYQLYLRTRLSTPLLGLLRRRVVSISLICWLPLLLLSLVQGHAVRGLPVPFLLDVEVHIRFLVALPLLIAAELIAHKRIVMVVRHFLDRHIVAPEDHQRFAEIISSTMRLRNSVLFEAVLLVLCFTLGQWIWKGQFALKIPTWYEMNSGGGSHLTAAGYWYEFLSLPIFRFILFRWYFRLFLWYQFLWRVRGLPLHLNLYHPDRAAGLGFLSASVFAFGPVLLAHTTFLAGFIGERIWHAGATLPTFKMLIIASLLFLLLLVNMPLTFFAVHLARAHRAASREFGILASHYVNDFRTKWVQHPSGKSGPLLGTPDIQSLADLGNSFKSVSDIRFIPFGKDTILRLGGLLILPLLPLTLTVVPIKQIIDWLIKLAF